MARTKSSEAKIKFIAETTEFNEGVNKAKAAIKEINSALKLTDTEMKNNGESIEGLQKKHDLLQDKLSKTQEKENLLNQKLQKAVEIFGENSDAAQKCRTDIVYLKNDEERLRGEINNCNNKMEEYASAMKASQTASAQLTQKIENQEKELGDLKKEYTDVVLEQGKTSDKSFLFFLL